MRCRLQQLNVLGVETILPFGGCCRPDQQMSLQHNFTAVQNAGTLGVIMLNVYGSLLITIRNHIRSFFVNITQ